MLIETVEPAWLGVKLELLRPKLFKFVVEDLLLGESVLKKKINFKIGHFLIFLGDFW